MKLKHHRLKPGGVQGALVRVCVAMKLKHHRLKPGGVLDSIQQRIPHRAGALPALMWVFGKGAVNDLAYSLRYFRSSLLEWNTRLFEDCPNRVVDAGLASEVQGKLAG